MKRLRKPSKRLLAQLTANKRRNWTVKKLKDQGGLCYWCAKRITIEPTCDHLIPLGRGGVDHFENVVAAHAWCNEAKGDKLPEEFAAPGQYDPREAFRKAVAS